MMVIIIIMTKITTATIIIIIIIIMVIAIIHCRYFFRDYPKIFIMSFNESKPNIYNEP